MNILITGAQLGNKGAESMLYITVDELRKRFPDCTLYFSTVEKYNFDSYRFNCFRMTGRNVKLALGGFPSLTILPKSILFDIAKIIIGRWHRLGHYFDTLRYFKFIDVIVDVSGFSIGTQWSRGTHEYYLDRIELAKKNSVPVYLMPQSFGPFDFNSKFDDIKERLNSLLRYPRIIFAREQTGYDSLINNFNLDNVIMSPDLVLQNKGIDWKNVFTSEPVINVPKVNLRKAVGIVPNIQCFKYQDKELLLNTYFSVIEQLVRDGFNVVIFRHSREDIDICVKLKNAFASDNRVVLESKELSCLEYNEYVKNFCFIICSRYHGIVHAYKNGIPSVILGWAEKYAALAKSVNQEKYAFDVRNNMLDKKSIIQAVKEMSARYSEESMTIQRALEEIQKENCFDIMEKDLRSIRDFK